MDGEGTLLHHFLGVKKKMINFSNFISIYDNALDKNFCTQIIEDFENDKENQTEGKSGNHQIKLHVKKSTDINHSFTDNSSTSKIISSCLRTYIQEYKKVYPDIDALPPWRITNVYNIQKYNPSDGYYKTHCEVTDRLSGKRVLVWMIYLNSVNDGGTLFPSYDIGVQAMQGRLVLWPPYWTHHHKGQISHTKTIYIATGWYEFIQ